MKVAVIDPMLRSRKNIVRDVIYGCWCGGKRIGGATVPPFEQLTLATILRQDGNDVVFVDAQAEQLSADAVAARIAGARLAVISTSVMTVNSDAEFICRLKEMTPGLKVAAYGSHPTFQASDTLAKGIDYAIQREPEWVVRALARALAVGDLAQAALTPGITVRGTDGTITVNPRQQVIEDLDEIPAIEVGFLPPKVVYFNPIVRNLPYLTVSTSHGCAAKCTYCTAPFFHGTRTRFMSAVKVLNDLGTYLAQGIREVYFRDETFTTDRTRVMAICEGIVERGYQLPWICNARVDTVDAEMLRAMRRAGCHLIKFGVESGNQAVLDGVKKGITLEQSRQAFDWCRDAGIDTHAHFMIGMPGDTADTIEETIAFALAIRPTTATFGICTPYPGTPLFREVFRRDASITDGADNAAMERLHVEGTFNHLYSGVDSATARRLLKRAYRRFYLRPSYLLGMLMRIRNRTMLRNAIIGGLNVFSFSAAGKGG